MKGKGLCAPPLPLLRLRPQRRRWAITFTIVTLLEERSNRGFKNLKEGIRRGWSSGFSEIKHGWWSKVLNLLNYRMQGHSFKSH